MIEYRAPDADEAAAIATLARETFDEAFGTLYDPEDLAAFYAQWKTTEAFAGFIANPRIPIRVAYDEGTPVGFALVSLDRHLDYDPSPRTAIELAQLYIRSAYHGRGVAQALMAWVEEEAETADADEIVLSVYSENHRGLAFYAKHGFVKAADTTFVVGKQVDAEYLYVKHLKE